MKSNRPELKLNLLGRAMVPKTTRIRISFMGLYKRTFSIAASVGVEENVELVQRRRSEPLTRI